MRRSIKRITIIAAVLGIGALAVRALRPRPIPVETARVVRGPMRVTVDEEARTRVRNRYVVSAPIAGRVERIAVREGDSVTAGQVVARIFAQPLDPRQRDAARARLAAARDAARAADAARAQAQTALAEARRRRNRVVGLAGAGGVSPEERDQAETQVALRTHDFESAEFMRQAAFHQVEEAQAALAAGEGAGAAVPLHAPIPGRVLAIPERSERVAAPGEPLVVIGDPTDIEIVADVLSTDAVQLQPGDTVFVEEWGGDHPLRGTVRLIEPSGFTKISALGVEEQRVHVVADLAETPAALGDGYRAEVRIVTWGTNNALRIPTSALFRDGASWAVFLVADGRARVGHVSVAHQSASDTEITDGLSEGDLVVIHPSDQLREGTRVAVASPEQL